jgi:methylglutaconyl-CoA hydratase
MPYTFLETRRDGPVQQLVLNRPELRNAYDDRMVGELTDWAHRAAADSTLRVVVLSGGGPVFCAGADLDWMTRSRTRGREEYGRDAAALSGMLHALDTLPQALIGRVQGAAIAGGIGLVAVCDIVVAAEDAVFSFPEVKLGIVPAVISPYVLARIGRFAARELFLTGARFSAARARELGLVNALVPEGELDAAVEGYVRELLSSAPQAVAAAKKLIREVAALPRADATALTAEVLAERRASEEAREGFAAFLEKRQPPWARWPG